MSEMENGADEQQQEVDRQSLGRRRLLRLDDVARRLRRRGRAATADCHPPGTTGTDAMKNAGSVIAML